MTAIWNLIYKSFGHSILSVAGFKYACINWNKDLIDAA
jgi:hypothetical protein